MGRFPQNSSFEAAIRPTYSKLKGFTGLYPIVSIIVGPDRRSTFGGPFFLSRLGKITDNLTAGPVRYKVLFLSFEKVLCFVYSILIFWKAYNKCEVSKTRRDDIDSKQAFTSSLIVLFPLESE